MIGSLLFMGAGSRALAGTYTTTFGGSAENPVSEGNRWINGKSAGSDWSDCAIVNHLAYGAQTTENPNGNPFNDSTAVLTGSWGPNQSVSGVVSIDRSGALNNNYLEIELRLNSSISAHSCTGYEIDYSANIPPLRTGYIYIVRWNGPFGNFTGLGNGIVGSQVNLHTGDVISATSSNGTIRAYINGTNFLTSTDSNPFTNGSPGIGFDMVGDHSQAVNYGFTSFTATDNVSPPVIQTQPQSQSIDLNSNAFFQVGASGTAPLSYQWYFNGTNALVGANGSQLTLSNVLAELAGNYSVVVSNPGGSVTSAVALLTVVLPQVTIPVINRQPSSRSAAVGSDVSFDVGADGTPPLLYQWFFNGNLMLLENGSTLNLTKVQTTQAGDYTVVVANLLGSTTSSVAKLTVLVPPSVTGQPSGQSAVLGSNVTFQVNATGSAPLSYQWLFGGSSIPGATSSSLTLTNVQAAQGGYYKVVVTNNVGSADSVLVQLVVVVPPNITTQPSNQAVVLGGKASFAVAASPNSPLNYQWYFEGNPISGAMGSTLNLTNVQATQAGGYSAVLTNIAGVVTSVVAQLTVLVPPTITTQPTNQTVIPGSNVNFQATAGGSAPLSYQWFFGGSTIAGATANGLTLTNVQSSQAGGYSVTVTNLAGAATSVVAQLTVLVPPTITAQPTNQTAIPGSNVTFQVTAAGSEPLSYQWFFGGSTISGATANVVTLTNVQSSQAGGYSVMITNSAGAATSVVAQLTVLFPPSITDQPTNKTVAPGSSATFQVGATGSAPLSYQWWFSGASIPGQTASSLLLTNVQSTQAGPYSVVITNAAGVVTSAVAQLTVQESPVITLQAGFDLNGSGALRISGAGLPNQNYLFQFVNDFANPNWQPLGNVTADNSGAFVFVDPITNSPRARFYRATPR